MNVASPLQRQKKLKPKYLHDMKISKDVESYKDVQSYISYYQLTQYLPGAWEDDIEHMELNKDRAARQVSTVIKLKKCVEMVAKGSSPIVLSFGKAFF